MFYVCFTFLFYLYWFIFFNCHLCYTVTHQSVHKATSWLGWQAPWRQFILLHLHCWAFMFCGWIDLNSKCSKVYYNNVAEVTDKAINHMLIEQGAIWCQRRHFWFLRSVWWSGGCERQWPLISLLGFGLTFKSHNVKANKTPAGPGPHISCTKSAWVCHHRYK